MKLSTAWRRLAQDFDECRRGERRYEAGAWLCNQLQWRAYVLGISFAQHDAMDRRIHDDIDAMHEASGLDFQTYDVAARVGHPTPKEDAENDAARVLVCLMFACEAEEAERAAARKLKPKARA